MDSDWGRKQFTAYLGENTALWEAHDATMLMRARGFPGPVLIAPARRTSSATC